MTDTMENLSFVGLIKSCNGNTKTAFKFFNSDPISFNRFFQDCCAMQNLAMNINGNNIGICLRPSYHWIVAFFGVQAAGKTAVLIDCERIQNEIDELCNKYSISWLITDNTNFPVSDNCFSELNINDIKPAQISTIIFTSGTEEKPKGVALSEKGILSSVSDALQYIGVEESDVVLHTLPFFHGFGLAAEVVSTIIQKSTLCFGKNIGLIAKDIDRFSVTVMCGVPQVIRGVLPYLKKGISLKKIVSGSSEIDCDTVNYLNNIGITVHCSYGLSECSPVVSVSKSDDLFSCYYSGRILPCCDVKIAEDGEICVKGDNVMLGYINGGELKKVESITEYYHTGDIGYIEKDRLYVTGRKKNTIGFSNGNKVSIEMLERKIEKCCLIADCLIFQRSNDVLDIIVYSPALNNCLISRVGDCLPLGISVGNLYYREIPFVTNTLNKKIRNIIIQLKDSSLL